MLGSGMLIILMGLVVNKEGVQRGRRGIYM